MRVDKNRFLIAVGLVIPAIFFGSLRAIAEPVPALQALDPRQALPLTVAPGIGDGFYVNRAQAGTEGAEMGFMARASGIYGNRPFGTPADRYFFEHRVLLQLDAQFFIQTKYGFDVEAGLSMPFALYQATTAENVRRTGVGDLTANLKAVLKFIPYVKVAAFLGLGFDTASERAFLGGGKNVTVTPRFILQSPSFVKNIFSVAANIGGIVSDNGTPCQVVPTSMGPGILGGEFPTGCRPDGKGLGNHFTYGVGIYAALSQDRGFSLAAELYGTHTLNEHPARDPLMLGFGIRRVLPNGFYFAAGYGFGLVQPESPAHVGMLSIGNLWGQMPPAKPKGPPSIKIDVNLTPSPQPGSTGGPAAPAGPDQKQAPAITRSLQVGVEPTPEGVVPRSVKLVE